MSKWLAAFRAASPENLTELTDLTETACIPEKGPQNTPISVSTPSQLGQKGSVRSVAAPAATPAGAADKQALPDKLGTTWGPDTARLIRWFQSTKPPAKPFELQPGVTIVSPALWWPSIAADASTPITVNLRSTSGWARRPVPTPISSTGPEPQRSATKRAVATASVTS